MAGLLLLGGAAAEITQGFRRPTSGAQRGAWVGGAYTLLLALLLLNAAGLIASALAIFVAVPFAVDGFGNWEWPCARRRGASLSSKPRGAATWNLAVMLGVLLLRRHAVHWVVALAAGLRLVGTTTDLVTAPVLSEREADDTVIADIRYRAARAPGRDRRPPAVERGKPCRGGSRLDRRAIGGPVHHSRQPHGPRQVGSRCPIAARRRTR